MIAGQKKNIVANIINWSALTVQQIKANYDIIIFIYVIALVMFSKPTIQYLSI